MRSRRASCDAGMDRTAAVSPDTWSAPRGRGALARRCCRAVALPSHLRSPRVVSLAAGRPANLRHDHDGFGCLVARDVRARMSDQLGLVGRAVRTKLYDGSDPLAK